MFYKHRDLIAGVKDARDDSIVSIETAVSRGILNQTEGIYNNFKTGEKYPIAVAMNAGFIIGEDFNAKKNRQVACALSYEIFS